MFFSSDAFDWWFKGKNIGHRTLEQLCNPFSTEEIDPERDLIIQSVIGRVIVRMRHRAISPNSFLRVFFEPFSG